MNVRPAVQLTSRKRARHNILLISLCSVRTDHMSCYGYHRRTTPRLDAFAEESLVFEHAISPWPKTAPAFAAVMSGKYGHTNGVLRVTPQQRLSDEHETLAELLDAEGYDTGAFSSSAAINCASNMLRGFQTAVESYRVPRPFDNATEQAVAWLKEERHKPFFAWVHYNNAHYPYRGGGAPRDMFIDDEFYDATQRVKHNTEGPLALDLPPDHPFRRQILRPDIGGVHPLAVLPERAHELAFYLARYDTGVYGADRVSGDLLDAVRQMGLLDNTIVVVVGDHGEALGDHNYFFEHGRFPYDDCAKVPMIIRPPGGARSHRVQAPVPILGLAPTLLEMTGQGAPDTMEASSFWDVAQGRGDPEYVFTESAYQLDYTLSVRDSTWKLIHVPNDIDRSLMTGCEYELYNLESDPGELNNLYDQRLDVADRLRAVLDDWSRPWIDEAYERLQPVGAEVDQQTLDRLRDLGYIE